MKKLRRIVFVIPFFMLSCAAPYLKNYEPINVFFKSEKLDSNKRFILKIKESNSQTLRIFNRGEGSEHIISKSDIDYSSKLFVLKHWKRIYNKYAQDSIKKYWKKEDFPEYEFIEEDRRMLFSNVFLEKHPDIHEIIILSEPIYYWNNKYIMFYYSVDDYLNSSTVPIVVVMKKEKQKWIVVEKIGDYGCSGCY